MWKHSIPRITCGPSITSSTLTIDCPRNLPWNSLLEVAFVGSESRNLPTYNAGGVTTGSAPGVTNAGVTGYNGASDLNVIPLGTFFGSTFSPGEIPANLSGGSTSQSASLGGLDTQQTDFFRKYPFYQHIYSLSHNFYANYNSLQVSWNKSAGMVSWGANYTFSKDLATAASYSNALADPINLRNDYNPATFDRSQVFNIHYLVNLGKRYKGGNRLLTSRRQRLAGFRYFHSGRAVPTCLRSRARTSRSGRGRFKPLRFGWKSRAGARRRITLARTPMASQPDKNGATHCVTNINSVVWMGSPDYELMPTVTGNPKADLAKHQFINPTAFGVPLPGSPTTGPYALSTNPTGQGQYRLPYIHGPAFLNNNLSLFKDFPAGEGEGSGIQGFRFQFSQSSSGLIQQRRPLESGVG